MTKGFPVHVHLTGLSWDGYDLLDSIRDDSVWKTVLERVGEVGGSVSVEILKAVAAQVIREGLGLPPG